MRNRQIPTESDIPMHGWQPYSDMHRERIKAHDKWKGRQSAEEMGWGRPEWVGILGEEFGEVCNVLNELAAGNITLEAAGPRLREELIQVGAMSAAWIEAIDSGEVR